MRLSAFIYRAGHILVLLGIIDLLTEPPVADALAVGILLMVVGLFAIASGVDHAVVNVTNQTLERVIKALESRT